MGILVGISAFNIKTLALGLVKMYRTLIYREAKSSKIGREYGSGSQGRAIVSWLAVKVR